MSHFKKLFAATLIAAVTAPAMSAELASWSNVELTGSSNNLSTQAFSTTSNDLYIQMTLTPEAGFNFSNNDFSVLWLDNNSTTDHQNTPNIGMKANVPNTAGDIMIRTASGTPVYTTDQAAANAPITLFAHLYKSTANGKFNTFDLWTNPASASWSTILASAPEAHSTQPGNSGLASFSVAGFRTANLAATDKIMVNRAAIFDTIPAVPEPETYAMMLAGLGLVGAIARRRKQK